MYNIRRILLFVFGLVILSLGSVLSMRSGLGVSPTSSISYVLSTITGFSVGTVTFVFFLVLVLAQKIILGRTFHPKNYLQVFSSSIFGLFMDLSVWITSSIHTTLYFGSLILLFTSIIFMGIGVSLILITDIIMTAPEGFCNAVSDRWKVKFSKVKTVYDVASALFTITLALIFIGKLTLIREGTIISALLVGRVVGFILEHFREKMTSIYTKESIGVVEE